MCSTHVCGTIQADKTGARVHKQGKKKKTPTRTESRFSRRIPEHRATLRWNRTSSWEPAPLRRRQWRHCTFTEGRKEEGEGRKKGRRDGGMDGQGMSSIMQWWTPDPGPYVRRQAMHQHRLMYVPPKGRLARLRGGESKAGTEIVVDFLVVRQSGVRQDQDAHIPGRETSVNPRQKYNTHLRWGCVRCMRPRCYVARQNMQDTVCNPIAAL